MRLKLFYVDTEDFIFKLKSLNKSDKQSKSIRPIVVRRSIRLLYPERALLCARPVDRKSQLRNASMCHIYARAHTTQCIYIRK